MKRFAIFGAILGCALMLLSCSSDRSVSPQQDSNANSTATLNVETEYVARDLVLASHWEVDADVDLLAKAQRSDADAGALVVIDCEREHVVDDIYHYSWRIRIGCDPFDVIGLHRVVKERAPSRPIRSRKSVFMLHGDYKDFVGCFVPGLYSDSYPNEFGIAVHLAEGNVDVWGMDQAGNSIPADETDFSSMADWDMFKFVDDTRTGMAVARVVRLFTGNGWRKLNLLGFSGGGALAFAVVNEESQLPRGHRHVGGVIPVDQGPFSDSEAWADADCETAEYYGALVDAGEYADPNFFPMFGIPARDDPNGESELIEGFTNWQAALAVAVYEYVEGFPYHFLAGTFDTEGFPDGLQYTNVDLWIDFMINAPPFFPNAFTRDELISGCGAEYAPWADHLADINLPVLYVSAAGGFGLQYLYSLDLMVSADVSTLTIELHPPEEVALDFGHVDLFTADNAPQLVWQPILDWVMNCSAIVDEEYPQVAIDR